MDYSEDISVNNNSKDCLLILHGIAGTPYDKKEMIEALSDIPFDIYVPLLPYHGVNYKELTKPDNAQEFYDWGRDLIANKQKEYNRVFAIGFSFGAGIIFHYITHHSPLDAMILLGTGGIFSKALTFIAWLSKFIRIRYIRVPYKKIRENSFLPDEYLEWKAENFPKIPLKMLFKEIRNSKKENHLIRKISSPFLIINGLKDPMTSKQAIPIILDQAVSLKKRGVLVHGVGHFVLESHRRNEIISLVKKFIKEIHEEYENGELISEKSLITI